MCSLAAGVVAAVAGVEAGLAVAAAAAFFECFFAGVAEASGLGLGGGRSNRLKARGSGGVSPYRGHSLVTCEKSVRLD